MAGLWTGSALAGKVRAERLRAVGAVLLGVGLLSLSGCNNFFQCENKPACPASTGTGSGSTSSVDYAYVAYTTLSGTTPTYTLVGYNIAGGALTQVADVTLSFLPVALAVSPNNEFLYVATAPGAANNGIYGFSIGSTGGLTALNSGNVLYTDQVGAMTISPDGNYLYTLDALGLAMTEYTFTSTGGLTSAGTLVVPSASCALGVAVPVTQTCSVAVSPEKNYVVASLGTAGDAVFPYTSSGGITNSAYTTIAAGTASGDFSVAIDASNNAYVAQTAGVTVYELTSSPPLNRGTVSFTNGKVPRSIVVDPDSKFVFTANEGTGTITAFTTGTTNALNGVTGSPFAAPAHVAALGVDSTDTYLVAVGYDGTAGIQLYSIASSGVLSALAKTAGTTTATTYPVLLAMSH